MLEFRLLRADEIDARISTCGEWGVSVLLYKDARVDMALLDETVGPMNWEKRYSRDNSNCVVSIWDDDKRQWISKEDVGTESFTESAKGLASDSFKRACFNWGIGRELYTAPSIFVKAADLKTLENRNGKWTCRDYFTVEGISYEGRKIIGVTLRNTKNNRRLVFGNAAEETAPAKSEAKFTKEFMAENSNKKITKAEVKKLTAACKSAGENMSLEKALQACKVDKPESITYTQYLALMANLNAAA